MQGEITELRKRADEFECMFNEVQNESKERLKEVEESQLKLAQLQITLERQLHSCNTEEKKNLQRLYSNYLNMWSIFVLRLELNVSNLESENQVLRQQALVASNNEELAEEIEV